MEQNFNHVLLCGQVLTQPQPSHVNHSQSFSRFLLSVPRLSGQEDCLPVFGTGTVLVPWGALCLLTGNVPKGLGLLALYGVISLVRSVLEPKIMAAQVDLPPLAALAAMYVGFCAFGVAGMVLCPMALLCVKQLHDSGWLRLWK